jgi:ketol-acid reductoisomerase
VAVASTRPVFSSLREAEARNQIESVGKELRSMMSWMKKK